jgi:hypothetical protein
MEIILEDDVVVSKKFWNAMFKIINESYRIEYIINKGKKYFNCSSSQYDATNTLNRMEHNNIKPFHKNHICKCDNYYMEQIEHKKYNNRKVNIDDIKYVYSGRFELNIIEDYKKFLLDNNRKLNLFAHDYFHSGNFNIDDIYCKDDSSLFGNIVHYHDVKLTNDFDKTKNMNKNCKKIIQDLHKANKLDISKVKFISNSDIIINNNSGFNEDHRGLNHTLIELPFVSEIYLGKEFTLEDLITANSNVKSHKFDYWYELYTDCIVENDENTNSISILLKYNHGS